MIKLELCKFNDLVNKGNGTVSIFTPAFHTFSGGEEHVSLKDAPDDIDYVNIYAQITSSSWLIRLILTANAIEMKWGKQIGKPRLVIPYLPYARQDRACNPGDAFSLSAISQIFDLFLTVEVSDVHSDVARTLIPHLFNQDQHYIGVKNVLSRTGPVDYIVAPDKGSRIKAEQWLNYWNDYAELPAKLIYASKVRDKTGNIIATKIENPLELSGNSTALIVDDICDGGRTFLELSTLLRACGVRTVYLYVTHGILSNGIAATGCDKVFTTDSLPEKDDGRIIVKRFLNI